MLKNGLLSELALSVASGVITAIVLEIFRPRRRDRDSSSGQNQQQTAESGGGFMRMLIAVIGGLVISYVGSAFLFQGGYVQRSPYIRVGLLVIGTIIVWQVLYLFRRR